MRFLLITVDYLDISLLFAIISIFIYLFFLTGCMFLKLVSNYNACNWMCLLSLTVLAMKTTQMFFFEELIFLITDVSLSQHRKTFGFLTIPAPVEEDTFVAVFFRFRFRKTIRMKADVMFQDCHLFRFLLGHIIAYKSACNSKPSDLCLKLWKNYDWHKLQTKP